MKKNNLILFVQSLLLLPIVTVSMTFPGMHDVGIYSGISQNVLAQKINIDAGGAIAFNQAMVPGLKLQTDSKLGASVDLSAQILKSKAQAIDAYFAVHDMPLVGMGMNMAMAAEINGIDWRLLPAIAVRESTGGKDACDNVKHNSFGWGSCKIGFKSDEDAIKTLAVNLGGNNPKTAYRYDNKSVVQILQAYNPPSIVPHYAEQVMSIMNNIGDAYVIVDPTATT